VTYAAMASEPDPPSDWTSSMFHRAAELWRMGWSTARIAAALMRDESEIWNRLTAIKALARR
jgi:hypothetical protein